jgi:hypothetical protein
MQLLTSSYGAWRPEHGLPVVCSLTVPRSLPEAKTWPRCWPLTPRWSYFHAPADEFGRAFAAQLGQYGPQRIAERLAEIASTGPADRLVLLCHERHPASPQDCHRLAFSRWWTERTGQPVTELDGCATEPGQPGPAVKALSIKQPWAWAVVTGLKDVENRGYRTRHRGRLLVHASKRDDRDGFAFMAARGIQVPDDLPRGAIVGSVVLTGVVDDSPSPWAEAGQQHWLLEDPEPWPRPAAARGDLGVWDYQPS